MVRYANQHKLKVAIRGDGHSRYGQTQAEAGVVIDSRSLNAVRVRTPHSADAQLGAFWSAVADTTLPKGLTPHVFPADCLAITVGGTLSAGGIGNTSHHHGAQVDNVTDLDVVTGDGRLVTCSPGRESELFDMVLAGQGQCGVIVRAGLRLMPAPTHVVLQELTYTDLDAYRTDHSRLASDGRFDSQHGTMMRHQGGAWSFVIEIGQFFTPPNEPNMQALKAHLRFASAAAPVRMTYHDYLFRFEARNAAAPTDRPSPVITNGFRPRRRGRIWTTSCRSPESKPIGACSGNRTVQLLSLEYSSVLASTLQGAERVAGVRFVAFSQRELRRRGCAFGPVGKQPGATGQDDRRQWQTLRSLLDGNLPG